MFAPPVPAVSRPTGFARLVRDRAVVCALVVLLAVVGASAAGGPLVERLVGHHASDLFPYSVDRGLRPAGPWSRVPTLGNPVARADGSLVDPPAGTRTTLLVLGADGPLGRDELIRLFDAGRATLEIGLGAMLVALVVGVPLGALGGFFGGPLDAGVARLTELAMAFPLLIFIVFASVRLNVALTPVALKPVLPPGVVALSLLIGVFTSYYPMRLARVHMAVLRDAAFVEGERAAGASSSRIFRRHLLPHLGPALLAWAALAVGTNILLEVGLSFVGVGIQAQAPTWGSMLSATWGTIYSPQLYDAHSFSPWLTLLPTAAIALCLVSLHQLADGVHRALEPAGEAPA